MLFPKKKFPYFDKKKVAPLELFGKLILWWIMLPFHFKAIFLKVLFQFFLLYMLYLKIVYNLWTGIREILINQFVMTKGGPCKWWYIKHASVASCLSTGQGCWPYAQPSTLSGLRTGRGLAPAGGLLVLFVWPLPLDQSDMGNPARRYISRQHSSQGHWDTQYMHARWWFFAKYTFFMW